MRFNSIEFNSDRKVNLVECFCNFNIFSFFIKKSLFIYLFV